MEYTVTLKLLYPDGYRDWGVRMGVDAGDEKEALQKAQERLKANEHYSECKILEYRIKPYEERDSYTFVYDTDQWRLEEENKTAPAEIARALNRIADNMRDFRQSPTPIIQGKGIDPFAFAALMFSAISVITLVILTLIFRQ